MRTNPRVRKHGNAWPDKRQWETEFADRLDDAAGAFVIGPTIERVTVPAQCASTGRGSQAIATVPVRSHSPGCESLRLHWEQLLQKGLLLSLSPTWRCPRIVRLA